MRMSSSHKPPAKSEEMPKGEMKSLKQLWAYLAPYKRLIVAAITALLFTSGSVLALGQGVRYLVDEGIGKGDVGLLNTSFVVLMTVTVCLALATFARYFFVTWIGERVVADIRNDVYARLIQMDATFFSQHRTGDLLSRLTTDTTLLQTVIGSSVSIALRNSVLLTGGCVMLLITSLRLSGYVFIMVPLVVIPIIVIGKRVRRWSRKSQDAVADISVQAEETLSAMTTIQSLSLETYETKKFGAFVGASLDAARSRIRLRAVLTAIVITLVFGAISSVLWVGGRDVIMGNVTAGDLASFLFYAMIVAGSTGAISEVIGDLQRAAGATERLMELKAMQPTICAPADPVALPEGGVKGNLNFEAVEFAYPAHPETPILHGLNLYVRAGEHVALVGPSGAGKSTLFHLALRAYDPEGGQVELDGVDVRRFDPSELRSQFGLVPQDPVIFSASAYENIALGKPGATREEVVEAARKAEALEFIEALPDGFDSHLGEKGVRLSGGQKQRVAIARAMIRNPHILLLDEATSALDSHNERKVQAAITRLMEGRTTLTIAHRLSTVQDADRIVVLNHGRIEAIGTHEELLARSETYAKLAKIQFEQAAA